MKTFTANVVIHFQGSPSEEKLGEVGQALRDLQGVRRVAPSLRLKGLMLVDYDPAMISAQSILAKATRRGVAGRLVGL